MSFSELPEEIKFKILKMLSVGSRYNASLVWEELADETWRSIPTIEEFSKMRTNSYCNHIENKILKIFKTDDLEMAGVLASAGHLDSLEGMMINGCNYVDLTSIPFNIVNSLFKVVRNELNLVGAAGFCFAMLDDINCKTIKLTERVNQLSVEKMLRKEVNIKCEKFEVMGPKIQRKISKEFSDISVSCNEVTIFYTSGNVCCLFVMILLGSKSLKSLQISQVIVSNINAILLNSLFKIVSGHLFINDLTGACSSMLDNVNCEKLELKNMKIPAQISKEISVSGRVILHDVSGNVEDLLDSLTCDCLVLVIWSMKMESDITRSLTKMLLESRVREIILCSPENLQKYFPILANYYIHGRCEKIQFKDFDDYMINYVDEELGRLANFPVTLFRRIN